MFELRHLKTLLSLAETGSLAAAAERLNLTQSALSHQLRELEIGLGLSLLDRSHRPVRLTPAGLQALAVARRVLPEVEALVQGLRRMARGEAGRLALVSECHSCLDWLLPRLARYHARWPAVELDVQLTAGLDALPRLLTGAIDLVLTPDRRELPGLAWHRLFDYELVLVVAARHALAARPHVSPHDLAGATLLTYPVERGRLDVFTRFLWPAGVEPQRVRQADSTTLLLELAALEQGVCVLPDWACAAARREGRIATVRLGRDGLPASLWAAVTEAQAGLPHLVAFHALLQGAS
ncbi:MAG: LysR substrate-binding domain-containing protein [Thiobacillaceae bacterium]|nr:LysR substrate-binding domain-containing protein [Thiobacillaceae bacterium]